MYIYIYILCIYAKSKCRSYLVISSACFDWFCPFQQICSAHCCDNDWICFWAVLSSWINFFLWASQPSWLTESLALEIVSIRENILCVTKFAWPILLDSSFEIITFVSLIIPGISFCKFTNKCVKYCTNLKKCTSFQTDSASHELWSIFINAFVDGKEKHKCKPYFNLNSYPIKCQFFF